MTEQTFEATPVWQRLFAALDQLDDEGMAALWSMSRYWRGALPGEAVVLVDTLDAVRDLALALTADRKGLTLQQIEAVVSGALAQGGENNR
jgi:hypothetical protein